jgi:hypothetical protein
MYAGAVLSFAVVAAIVLAMIQGPAQSQRSSSAVVAGPRTPVPGVVASVHVRHFVFRLLGERGSLWVAVAFPAVGTRSWDALGGYFGHAADVRFGQSNRQGGGYGKHVEAGGHASAWHARLVGFVIPKDGGPKQRVVLKLKGRPEGTFTLVPLQAGALKRDSGTQVLTGSFG